MGVLACMRASRRRPSHVTLGAGPQHPCYVMKVQYVGLTARSGACLLALMIEGCVQAGLASQQRRFHWDKRKRAYVQLQSGEQVKAGKRMRVESGALVAGKAQPSGMYQRWSRATQLRVAAPGDLEDPSAKPHANLADRCACPWINLGCVGCMLATQSLIKYQGGGGLLSHACVLR